MQHNGNVGFRQMPQAVIGQSHCCGYLSGCRLVLNAMAVFLVGTASAYHRRRRHISSLELMGLKHEDKLPCPRCFDGFTNGTIVCARVANRESDHFLVKFHFGQSLFDFLLGVAVCACNGFGTIAESRRRTRIASRIFAVLCSRADMSVLFSQLGTI